MGEGYDKNCRHHDLEVLNNPVPSPSTSSSSRREWSNSRGPTREWAGPEGLLRGGATGLSSHTNPRQSHWEKRSVRPSVRATTVEVVKDREMAN
jgi:hypothetical protein